MKFALTTIAAAAVSWVVALLVWVPGVLLPGWAPEQLAAYRPLRSALFLGAPLAVAVPLIHVPVLAWLAQRRRWRFPRLVLVSIFLALPLAAWPVGLLNGAVNDVRAGHLTGIPKLLRGVTTPEAQWFAPMYGTFGLVFGAWLARHRFREKSSRG